MLLKKIDIFILFFINLLIFFIIIFVNKVNCEIVLSNPKQDSYIINIDKKQINTELLNDEILEIKLPYTISKISIDGLSNSEIKSVFVNGVDVKSLDNINQNLIKLKVKNLIKVFGFTFFGLFIELILMALFFIPEKDKFWEELLHSKKVLIFSFCILGIFILWNFYNIYQNAVDLPFWDEWEALLPGRLDNNLNLNWLLSFHNEHKIFWTRLYTWILFHFDGWNLRHQIIINFFLYLSSMIVLYKIIPDKNSLLPIFFIPCFSDVLIENQLTGFQSVFYFMLLFSFLAIYFGFVKEDNLKNSLLFAIFTLFSMFSMTFVSGVALLGAYIIKQRALNKKVLIVSIIIILGVLLFYIGYDFRAMGSYIVLPNKLIFWIYYFRLILMGLLNITLSSFFTLLFGIFLFALCIYFCIKEKNKKSFYIYLSLFFLSFILSASISAGRASLSLINIASRYLNVVNFLIPCFAACIFKFKYYKCALAYLIILVFCFFNSYSFSEYYGISDYRIQAKKKLLLTIEGENDKIYIDKVNPSNIKECIDRAKELNISFLRGFNNE